MAYQTGLRAKTANWTRWVLSCCDRHDDEDDSPRLVIHFRQMPLQLTMPFQSEPSNFRREDISLPGLTEYQYSSIREKAITDAGRMYETLHPLRSNPNSANNLFTYGRPPNRSPSLPPYRDVSPSGRPQARSASALHLSSPTPRQGRLDKIRKHSRKISDSLASSLSIAPCDDDRGKYKNCSNIDCEMRAMAPRKLSHESDSTELSRSDIDHDSAVAGMRIK
ncbi:hypothetical protein K431DRAFT_292230 [Polychaeton citri CBS 116435]|uniref:Uncharacterized protein n=1 Tax=Polychaeton citri CBS 116435 TaxID=1314669 RepID=A0A9P4QD07_9PEZI|nr:hypothetical protein K431DRAFT_292230 [Polychaeton citri CBS 116435]